jgi:uncharacterized membrane protein
MQFRALHVEENMIDLLYLALTVFAFAALIAYVRACALLGREDNTDMRGKDER